MHVAHLNIARLRALPGDPLVAEFIDNVPRVNALAERSPGFVWRMEDDSARVAEEVAFEPILGDPLLVLSLSVWESAEHLRFFVNQTVHGAFLRRRENWFETMEGPNYVIWEVAEGYRPSVEDGQERLALLNTHGPTDAAYDFSYLKTAG